MQGRTMRSLPWWILPALASTAAWAGTPRQELSQGRVQVLLEPRHPGLRVLYDGIEVIRHSELVITTPGWAPHYYVGPDERAVADAVQEPADGGARLRLVHRGADGSFEGVETITLHADGRIEQVLDARFLKQDAEALLQWRIGGLNPTLIVGRPYAAELAGGETVRGVVPVAARSAERAANTLARGFRTLEFDSRLGPMRIEVEGEPDLIVYDYRKDRWATPDNPYFWFGDLGTRLKAGQTVRYRIVYHLPPDAPTSAPAGVISAVAASEARPDVQTYVTDDPPVIIPRPKRAEFGPGGFVLAGRPQIAIVAPAARPAVARWARHLADRHGVTIALDAAQERMAGAAIRFQPAVLPNWSSEGYQLTVSPAGIAVEADSAAGFRYAVETLIQLTACTPGGEVVVRSAAIRDWPALRFRGVHMFTGGQGPELHLKLIRNVLAALKMNTLVLQAEYVEWDAYPEIHHPQFGMPKDDVRQILRACAETGIEVIPLVMSLGHCQWMFETGHHLELAEDPDAKWAYCATNPATYEFIFRIYAEALELFQPKWFHIGHDEFDHRGRVPYRESSRPFTVEQLFLTDTQRLHAWLAEREVRTMMWGDMLLAKGEGPDACHAKSKESAAALRAELPDDILIADWHYCGNPPEDFTNLDVFHAAGFETVAATWDRPANIVNFARAAYAKNARGLLQTTWAGYSLDPESFARHLPQYAAYVLAAEAAWNADQPPDPDTYPARAHFLDLMGLSALPPANRSGWVANIEAACNYALAAADERGWFELGPEHDLRDVPSGRTRLKGVAFQIGAPADRSAIVLRSKLTHGAGFPSAVDLTLERRAARLVILHATNFACADGAPVGQYCVTYDDGTEADLPVVYGRNVLAYGDGMALAEAPVVWSGTTASGEAVALRALVWSHPRPDRVIRTLTLRSADAAGALIVVGVSGLD